MAPITSFLPLALLALPAAFAHPGHNLDEEIAERAAFIKRSPQTIQSCESKLTRRGHVDASVARRAELAQKIRTARGINTPLVRRDLADYNYTHKSSESFALGGDETDLFADNSTCLLAPEVEAGPYYVDGELIRTNLTEDQAGIPLYLDVQLINTATCEPVPAVYVDLWSCNATGVYSGVAVSGNGDSDDLTNLDATFLRGVSQTDVNGVVQFRTIFPGHYDGRATHIHVVSHNTNDTIVRTNSTILGANTTARVSHIGQTFFTQDLISLVEATSPYTENTQDLTLNTNDRVAAQEAVGTDPYYEYVMLGDNLSDGILAWISMGIDPIVDDDLVGAATIYKEGGEAHSGTFDAGGDSTGTGGEMPSGSGGAMPSGTGAPPS